jgi:rRNA maturation endonuclease Nob1
MAGQLNFQKFKDSFFEELDVYVNPVTYSIFNEQIKNLFERVEFRHQSEYDSRCRRCGTKFNVGDFPQCPDCGSKRIERNF